MTICKDWLTFFAVVALLACNALFASTLKFSLDPKVIMPGEHARLEIRIPSQGLPSITDSPPVIHDELLTKADSLRIVEQSFNNRGNELVWTYDLTLTKLGKTTVPPVEIQLGSQSFSTEATLLELKSPRQQGDDNLRDDFWPREPSDALGSLDKAFCPSILSCRWWFGLVPVVPQSLATSPAAQTSSSRAWGVRFGMVAEKAKRDSCATRKFQGRRGWYRRAYDHHPSFLRTRVSQPRGSVDHSRIYLSIFQG